MFKNKRKKKKMVMARFFLRQFSKTRERERDDDAGTVKKRRTRVKNAQMVHVWSKERNLGLVITSGARNLSRDIVSKVWWYCN